VRRRAWLGLIGILPPAAAAAAESDVTAIGGMPMAIPLLAVASVAAAAAVWALWRLRREAGERRRVLEALASSRALLGAQPAAVYRRDCRTGAETVIPGASTKLGLGRTADFTDFLACFDPADATALAKARRQLGEDGAEFHLEARASRTDTRMP